MFFPTWIDCFYLWKRRRIMIQKKNNGSTWHLSLRCSPSCQPWYQISGTFVPLTGTYLDLSWIIGITWIRYQNPQPVVLPYVGKRSNALTKTGSVALDSIIMCSNKNDGNQLLCKRQRSSLSVSDSLICYHIDQKKVASWTVPDLWSVLPDVERDAIDPSTQ